MRKIISLVAIISFLALATYLLFEPEMIKGTNVSVSQTVTGEITLTCDDTVSGLSNIRAMTGGTSNGTFSCTSTTNNNAGYSLKLKKSAQLCHSAGCGTNQQFDDYTGTTTDPIDYNWVAVAAGAEQWGFNMTSGTDITQRFRDNGSTCNVANGNVTNGKCWVRIPTSPTEETVANRTSPTAAGGSASGFGIRIQAGGSNHLKSGSYTTTLVVTAAMN